MTSSLDSHLENTINTDELVKMRDLVFSEYSKKSIFANIILLPKSMHKLKRFKGEIGFAKKDFRPLKVELDIDILVVLEIFRHGAYRNFNNYVPISDPQGHVAGLLYAINLNTNEYIQYLEFNERVQPSSEWDDYPHYPSITTSYYQAVENVKKMIVDTFNI